MKPRTLMFALLAFVMGCSSVPQKHALLNQVEIDTQGMDAEVLEFDSANQVATVLYHHRIIYGKTSAVRYQFDGANWKPVEKAPTPGGPQR